jgi:hypothetical protein
VGCAKFKWRVVVYNVLDEHVDLVDALVDVIMIYFDKTVVVRFAVSGDERRHNPDLNISVIVQNHSLAVLFDTLVY